MTPEVQEYRSRCYTVLPLCFLRLNDGRIAVGRGLGSRDFLFVAETDEAILEVVKRFAEDQHRADPPAALPSSILSGLDLGDL